MTVSRTLPVGKLRLVDCKNVDRTATMGRSKDDFGIDAYLPSDSEGVSAWHNSGLFGTNLCQFLMTASVESMIVPLQDLAYSRSSC
jgi:hypothetical protein